MKAVTVQFRRNFDDGEGRCWQSEPEAHSVFYEQPLPVDEVAEWVLYMLEEHYPVIRRRRRRSEMTPRGWVHGPLGPVQELRDDHHVGDEVYFRFRFPEGEWHHFVMSTSCYRLDLSKTVYVKELDAPPFWVQEEPQVLLDYELTPQSGKSA